MTTNEIDKSITTVKFLIELNEELQSRLKREERKVKSMNDKLYAVSTEEFNNTDIDKMRSYLLYNSGDPYKPLEVNKTNGSS